jgi:hypothetical protein
LIFIAFLERFRPLAGVFIARIAIEFVVTNPFVLSLLKGSGVLCVPLYPLACVVPSCSCLSKFFENTRDCGLGAPAMVSTRSCQKISDSTAQWFPLNALQVRRKQLRLD